ncbi:MAG: hypothetical protein DI576_01215 [Actinomyces sp.]|nr:MAG: hypothetical protein DI576_01215 [Actinomyces sp.]
MVSWCAVATCVPGSDASGPVKAGLGPPAAGRASSGLLEPISVRNSTDLETEVNRSRRGTRPISAKGWKRQRAAQGLSCTPAPRLCAPAETSH